MYNAFPVFAMHAKRTVSVEAANAAKFLGTQPGYKPSNA
jgi:hypothetical protein